MRKLVMTVLTLALFLSSAVVVLGFQAYYQPFHVLDFPRGSTPSFVGYRYSGSGQFTAPDRPPIPTTTITSAESLEVLQIANSNGALNLNVQHMLSAALGAKNLGLTVDCFTGLKLLEPSEDIPLPSGAQKVVTSALYVDTVVLANASNKQLGATLNASINGVNGLLTAVKNLVAGSDQPAPLPSPVSSLDCSSIGSKNLSDLQVALGTPATQPPSAPASTPTPVMSPAAGAATTAPGAAVAAIAPSPVASVTASSAVQLAIDASLSRVAIQFQKGSGLIVAAEIIDTRPLTLPVDKAEFDLSGTTSANASSYTLSINPSANTNKNALCVDVELSSPDFDTTREYCPQRSHIIISSSASLNDYRPPAGFTSPYRVFAQTDDNSRAKPPTFVRTQISTDLSDLTIVFDQRAQPTLKSASGTVKVISQPFDVTPETAGLR